MKQEDYLIRTEPTKFKIVRKRGDLYVRRSDIVKHLISLQYAITDPARISNEIDSLSALNESNVVQGIIDMLKRL